jgi:hypothetical protein
MLEKLVWISAFMLVGAKHKANVGQVESSHKEEVRQSFRNSVVPWHLHDLDPAHASSAASAAYMWVVEPSWAYRLIRRGGHRGCV